MESRPKRSLRAPTKLATRGKYVDDEEDDSPLEDSSSSESGNDSEAGDDSDDDPSWDGRRMEEEDFNAKPKKPSRGGYRGRGRGRGRAGRPSSNGHYSSSSGDSGSYMTAVPAQAFVQPAFAQQPRFVPQQPQQQPPLQPPRVLPQYNQHGQPSPSAAYVQHPGAPSPGAFAGIPPGYRTPQGGIVQPLGRPPVPPQLSRPLAPGTPSPQQQLPGHAPTHIPGFMMSTGFPPNPTAQLLAKTALPGAPVPPGGFAAGSPSPSTVHLQPHTIAAAQSPTAPASGLENDADALNRKRKLDGSPVPNGIPNGTLHKSAESVASGPGAADSPATTNPFMSAAVASLSTPDAAARAAQAASPAAAYPMQRPAFNGIGLPSQVAGAHVPQAPQQHPQQAPAVPGAPSLIRPPQVGSPAPGSPAPTLAGGLNMDPFRDRRYSSGGMGNSTIASALFAGPDPRLAETLQQQSQMAALRQSLGSIVANAAAGRSPFPQALQQQHPSLALPGTPGFPQAGQAPFLPSPQMQQYLQQKQQQQLLQHHQLQQQMAYLRSRTPTQPQQQQQPVMRGPLPTPPPRPAMPQTMYYQQQLPADPGQRKMVVLMQRCEQFSNQLKSVLSKWQEYSNREKEQARAEAAISGASDSAVPTRPAPAHAFITGTPTPPTQPRTGTPTPATQPRTLIQPTSMSFIAALQAGQLGGTPSAPSPSVAPTPTPSAAAPGAAVDGAAAAVPALPTPSDAAAEPSLESPPLDVGGVDVVQALVDSLLSPSVPALTLPTAEPIVDLTLASGTPAGAAQPPKAADSASAAPAVGTAPPAPQEAATQPAVAAPIASDAAAVQIRSPSEPGAAAPPVDSSASGASEPASASAAATAPAAQSAPASGVSAASASDAPTPVAAPASASPPETAVQSSTATVAGESTSSPAASEPAAARLGEASAAAASLPEPAASVPAAAVPPPPAADASSAPALPVLPGLSVPPTIPTAAANVASVAPMLSSQGAALSVASVGPSATVPVPPGDEIGMIKQPDCLTAELRSYQLIGLNWLFLLYKQDINGILADEMGLGKTIQTISLLGLLKERKLVTKPHLIIVPATAMQNWQRELSTWCPDLKVVMYSGSARERETLRTELLGSKEERHADPEGARNLPDVLLSTYNLACNKVDRMKLFKKVDYSYIVLDEAHQIKNVASSRYQNLLKLAYKSERRLLLTGTPLQNNINELWALLSFLMPQIFGDAKEFMDLQWDEGDSHDEDIQRLRRIIQPFVLRRLKSEVLMKLPPKTESIQWCEMAPYRQRDLYFDTVSNSRSKFRMMQELKQRDREQQDQKRQAERALEGKNRQDASESLRLEAERRADAEEKPVDGEDLKNWRRQLAKDKEARLEQEREGDLQHILMQLRKASNNPLLFRKFYTDEICDKIEVLLNQRAKQELGDEAAAAENSEPGVKSEAADGPKDAPDAMDVEIKSEVKSETDKNQDGARLPELESADASGRRGQSRQSTPRGKARDSDPEAASAPKRRGSAEPAAESPRLKSKARLKTEAVDRGEADGTMADGPAGGEAQPVPDGSPDAATARSADADATASSPADETLPDAESEAPADGDADNEAEQRRCPMCGGDDDVVLCSDCAYGYHIECLGSSDPPPAEGWLCPDCETKEGPGQPDLSRAVRQIIDALDDSADTKGRKRSELFQYLPDRQMYEDYYKLIKNPVCLTMLKKRPYSTPEAIRRDFHTLFANALNYNQPGSQVYRDALTLKKVFLEEFEAAFAEVSADEEIPTKEIVNSVSDDSGDDESKRGRNRKSGGAKGKAGGKAAAKSKSRASSGGRKSGGGGGGKSRPATPGAGRERPTRTSSGRATPPAAAGAAAAAVAGRSSARSATRSPAGVSPPGPVTPSARAAPSPSKPASARAESGEESTESETSLRRSARSRKRKSYKEESYDSMDDDQFLDSLRTTKRIRPTVKLDDALENCRSVIEEVMEHEYAPAFNEAVDTDEPGLETYLDIVKRPMHLRKVYDNVSSGKYKDANEFIGDVKLVFDNCLLFNEPGSAIALSANHLWTYFKREMRKINIIVEGAQAKLTQKMKLRKDLVDLGERLRQKSDVAIHRFCKDYGLTDFYLPDAELFETSGKLIELRRLLESLRARGSRVLIFTQFTQMLNILEEFLSRLNWRYQRLDGKTPVLERQHLIDEFTNDPDIFVFLLSTRAGGMGINLTSADVCIFHDIDWNPEMDRQAEARIHRIGQVKPVEIIKLLGKDTIDEHIFKLAQSKKDRNDLVMGEERDHLDDKEGELDAESMNDMLSSIFS